MRQAQVCTGTKRQYRSDCPGACAISVYHNKFRKVRRPGQHGEARVTCGHKIRCRPCILWPAIRFVLTQDTEMLGSGILACQGIWESGKTWTIPRSEPGLLFLQG